VTWYVLACLLGPIDDAMRRRRRIGPKATIDGLHRAWKFNARSSPSIAQLIDVFASHSMMGVYRGVVEGRKAPHLLYRSILLTLIE
jgi:hypothetical protein